jgi:hypothetical protein
LRVPQGELNGAAATRLSYILYDFYAKALATEPDVWYRSENTENQRNLPMQRITAAAEYRYFSFTNYYFGKANLGLAENR